MKKIIVIAIALIFSATLFAQDKKMSEIKTSDLPKGVSQWVDSNLPGGKITRAGKIEEKGTLSYVAVVEAKGRKHSYIFDKAGKFVGKGDNLTSGSATKAGGPAASPAPANTDPKQKGAPTTTTPAKTNATQETAPKK